MSEQQAQSHTQNRKSNTSGKTPTSRTDEHKERQQGGHHSYRSFAPDTDSTSSGGFGSSVNIYSAAAGRGNFDPAVAGTFDTYNEGEGGIRDLKRIETVSEVGSTAPIGPIYKDGVANNEEEIQDMLQAGWSRPEIQQEFGVPVDRKGRQETEPNDIVDP